MMRFQEMKSGTLEIVEKAEAATFDYERTGYSLWIIVYPQCEVWKDGAHWVGFQISEGSPKVIDVTKVNRDNETAKT